MCAHHQLVADGCQAPRLGHAVRVAGFDTHTASLADGTVVELRKPRLSFDGPTPQLVSLRAAQPIIGLGLLEAVPEADILARVRATPDKDGVKGQANYVYDPDTGAVRLGRFGWKAGKFSLRHQSASALLDHMSVTTSVFPSWSCRAGPRADIDRGRHVARRRSRDRAATLCEPADD